VNSPAQPAGGALVMSAGAGITLIAAGAILRFAAATTSTHRLNVHVVGVILILAGVLGLLLSLVWGVVLNRRRDRPTSEGRAAQPPTRQHVNQDQPPATGDRRVYQDQPPV
jgi:membrane protein DedA with SNARE-associated domain